MNTGSKKIKEGALEVIQALLYYIKPTCCAAELMAALTTDRLTLISAALAFPLPFPVKNGEKRPKYETLRDIICCLGISADQIFYPDLENDTDAQQVMRLYGNCSERDRQLVKSLLSAIYKNK